VPGDDWRPKFERILGSANKLNLRNDRVLDATGVRNGPAHVEVMVTPTARG